MCVSTTAIDRHRSLTLSVSRYSSVERGDEWTAAFTLVRLNIFLALPNGLHVIVMIICATGGGVLFVSFWFLISLSSRICYDNSVKTMESESDTDIITKLLVGLKGARRLTDH